MPRDELKAFLDEWRADDNHVKPLFTDLLEYSAALGGVEISYRARPGVSHSVRLSCGRSDRPFFAILDVIDDDPAKRWLSACFYADMVSDPEERGDVVPGGLEGGHDALCFDVEEPEGFAHYLKARIAEGARA